MTHDSQPLFGDGKDEFAFKLLRNVEDYAKDAEDVYTDGRVLYHAFHEWHNFGLACTQHGAKVFDGRLTSSLCI